MFGIKRQVWYPCWCASWCAIAACFLFYVWFVDVRPAVAQEKPPLTQKQVEEILPTILTFEEVKALLDDKIQALLSDLERQNKKLDEIAAKLFAEEDPDVPPRIVFDRIDKKLDTINPRLLAPFMDKLWAEYDVQRRESARMCKEATKRPKATITVREWSFKDNDEHEWKKDKPTEWNFFQFEGDWFIGKNQEDAVKRLAIDPETGFNNLRQYVRHFAKQRDRLERLHISMSLLRKKADSPTISYHLAIAATNLKNLDRHLAGKHNDPVVVVLSRDVALLNLLECWELLKKKRVQLRLAPRVQ